MVSWSTDAINERERFSYWREMICTRYSVFRPKLLPNGFSARIKVRDAGLLRFATCESTSYEIIRTGRDIEGLPQITTPSICKCAGRRTSTKAMSPSHSIAATS